MFYAKQQGSAAIMAIVVMVFLGIMISGLVPMVTAEVKNSAVNLDSIKAEYAAQAGAKYGIDLVRHNENEGKWPLGTWLHQKVSNASDDTYDLSISADNIDLPTRYTIISTGTSNGSQKTVTVEVDFRFDKPNLFQLFANETVSYSKGKKWKITNAPKLEEQRANPPDSDFNQVLFGDKLKPAFKVSYNVSLNQILDKGATGYGIYYFATGTADNMTSYVFQYDPGAQMNNDGGAFFVKKVIRSETTPNNPSDNEMRDNNQASDYRKAFKDNTSSETLRVSLNDLKHLTGNKNFQIQNQSHIITIEVTKDGQHIISIDGVQILYFYDKQKPDSKTYIPKENAGTGLRVWNANVNFYNVASDGQLIWKSTVWRK